MSKMKAFEAGYESAGSGGESSSITTPSTTSSIEDAAPADSEYGDGVVTWPWMQYIHENGDLLYVDSFCETITLTNDSGIQCPASSETTNSSKDGGIQRRLRNVMKRTETKRNSFKSGVSNQSSGNSWKSTASSSSLKNSLQELFFHKSMDKGGSSQPPPPGTKNEKVEMVSDNLKLISRNIILQLGNAVEKDFINLENVLGIISGLELNSIADTDTNISTKLSQRNPNAIVVQGIIPNSPTGRCSDIGIDDVVVAINGINVNAKNIHKVLTQVNGASEVVVKIERMAERGGGGDPDARSELCSLVCNDVWEGRDLLLQARGEMCAIMYLTLNSNEDEPDSDILFWYPDSPLVEKLKGIRGIFLTLNDIMVNVTGSTVRSSMITVDGHAVNVCYEKFETDVFVVAVSSEKCPKENLERRTCQFLEVLRVLYGDVAQAFSSDILLSMRHLIEKFADTLLQADECFSVGMKQLQLLTEQYTDISTLLTDAESADYGECEDDFFPHQRLYSTVGTCLFYKDLLVCNHLPDKLLKIIVCICTYHWLYALVKMEKLNQLIFWKELFLDSLLDEPVEDNEEGTKEEDEAKDGNKFRWFLLVVGQGRSLFCTLLQAGGVASVPEGNPGPHPFYVDTAWSILKYLLDVMEIETTCATAFEVCSSPAVVAPSHALDPRTVQSPRALELISRKISAGTDAYIRANSVTSGDAEAVPAETTVSRDSSISGSSGNLHTSYFERASNRSSGTNTSLTTAISTKLTLGPSNTLFSFTILQPYSGIFISPNFPPSNDPFTSEILSSYKTSCEAIHEMFNSGNDTTALQLEHGVLFQLDSQLGAEMKKGWANIRYWVVGRLVKRLSLVEEVYVCFEDGVPQNVIEMAYKMRFGCYY